MDEQTLTWQKRWHQHQVSFFRVPFSLNFWVCDAQCHTVTPTVGRNFGLDASCNPHPPTQDTWIPNSTQITKLYQKEELVEKE